jgi:hypothetical protein
MSSFCFGLDQFSLKIHPNGTCAFLLKPEIRAMFLIGALRVSLTMGAHVFFSPNLKLEQCSGAYDGSFIL